jgi:hypothetical protein
VRSDAGPPPAPGPQTPAPPVRSPPPALPVEFIVRGVAISQQASAASRNAWKQAVGRAGAAVWGGGWLMTGRVSLTIYYFPEGRMIGDLDNIIKPIVDGLIGAVYVDDQQVERLAIQKFEADRLVRFLAPSPILAAALAAEGSRVYVRVSDDPHEDLMSPVAAAAAPEALDEATRRLETEGYAVRRSPADGDLPAFLAGAHPHAIATGRWPHLVVEVMDGAASEVAQAEKLQQLGALVQGHPEWRLEVVRAGAPAVQPAAAYVAEIRRRLKTVRKLARSDRPAAMVMAWSLLEAEARVLEPDRAARTLTPATTTELLTSLGYAPTSATEALRAAGHVRDLIAHGDLTADLTRQELDRLMGLVDEIAVRLEKEPPGEG